MFELKELTKDQVLTAYGKESEALDDMRYLSKNGYSVGVYDTNKKQFVAVLRK